IAIDLDVDLAANACHARPAGTEYSEDQSQNQRCSHAGEEEHERNIQTFQEEVAVLPEDGPIELVFHDDSAACSENNLLSSRTGSADSCRPSTHATSRFTACFEI